MGSHPIVVAVPRYEVLEPGGDIGVGFEAHQRLGRIDQPRPVPLAAHALALLYAEQQHLKHEAPLAVAALKVTRSPSQSSSKGDKISASMRSSIRSNSKAAKSAKGEAIAASVTAGDLLSSVKVKESAAPDIFASMKKSKKD